MARLFSLARNAAAAIAVGVFLTGCLVPETIDANIVLDGYPDRTDQLYCPYSSATLRCASLPELPLSPIEWNVPWAVIVESIAG